jgi:O-antigen ligase
MHSYAFTFESRDNADRRDITLPTADATIFRFWIPLIAIGVAVFAAQHSLHYATASFIEGTDETDLVEVVGSSSQLRQISFVALGFLGALLLSMRSALQLAVDRWLLGLLFALCGWIVLSAFWSGAIELSLKRSFVPLLSVVAALGIAKHWHPRQVCRFTVLITGFFVLLGVAAECLNRTFLTGDDYRFAGTLHPNDQALNCAALCLASLGLLGHSRLSGSSEQRWLWWMTFLVGLAFLLLTRSRTTTAAFLAALFVFYYIGISGKLRVFVTGCVAMIAALTVIVFAESERGHQNIFIDLVTMGRDMDSEDITSLTGRIPIWKEVIHDIAQRPLGGYGYGAFWTPQRVLTYSYIHDWEFSHAHSGYFETLLNVGVIGLGLGLLLVVKALWSAMQHYKTTNDSAFRFIIAIFTLALVHGLADSNFVTVGLAPLIAILCIAIVALHRETGHQPEFVPQTV